jgi:diguanylate cyclase (GGDEF)-like protein/PAS domain S-box-containing protein
VSDLGPVTPEEGAGPDPATAARGGGSRALPIDDHFARLCLRNLLASTSEAIYFKDLANRFVLVSRGVVQHHVEREKRLGRAEAVAGIGPEYFSGKTDLDIVDEALASEWMEEERRIIETGEVLVDVLERDTSDDTAGWFRTSKAPLRDDEGRVIGTFGISRDVTAQVEAEHAVLRREAQLRALVESSPDAIAFYDGELRYCFVNAKAASLAGVPAEQMLGRTDSEIGRPPELVELLEEGLRRALATCQMCEVSYSVGATSWYQARIVPHIDGEGELVGAVVATRDLTELKKAQAVLAHQALHDPLTGALNRSALMDRLRRAVAALEREPGRVALLFIDLDNFKLVNDARGHDAGDQLLVEVAARLSGAARAADTVARHGGDEFVMILERLSASDNAYLLADRVLSTLAQPFSLGGETVRLTGSIGVVVTSDPAADPGELLRDADLAMYRAKQKGRDRIELFHPILRAQQSGGRKAAAELRRAVEEHQFLLLYQPLYSLGNSAVVGAEALARWRHPSLGVVGPDRFIYLAEELDLICALGSWALEEACSQLARWKAVLRLEPGFHVAVNVSARQLASAGFAEEVAAVISKNGLAPGELCLDITETGLVEEWGRCGETLDALAAIGARLALDDFGTGYSSLAHLHNFRVNTLKIDRHFVERLGAGGSDAAIVSGVVAMAHALGMAVVAEGVETESQLRQVQELDCDEAQGYLFAKPLSPEAMANLISGWDEGALSA